MTGETLSRCSNATRWAHSRGGWLRPDQVFIRSKFDSIEAALGPIHEPDRPRPMTDLATARDRAGELEALFSSLVAAEQRSRKTVPLVALVIAAFFLLISRLEAGLLAVAGAYAFGILLAAFDLGIFWYMWPQGSRSFAYVYVRGVPTLESIGEASRGFHDAVRGLNDSDRHSFIADLSTDRYPLLAAAASTSWTLLPGVARDEFASASEVAQLALRADGQER